MSDRSSTTDAPGGSPPEGGNGRSPERADISGSGNGTDWGAGDFSVPPGAGSGWGDNQPGGDANQGHQGGALPSGHEPPPPDDDERGGKSPDVEQATSLRDPVPLLSADSDSGSGEGGGDHHRPRWVEGRPDLDPPPGPARARPPIDAASQGAAETQKARSHGR